ncbi:hypothetical protein [Hymenobacter rubidus]|uniref:hypothetical protein n=1 Tax=Hymenobacter rubidus TaxID=1441626 RepID=UPI00191F4D93|nr:hypothetical protein [Hymenobacter rubidus]
MTSFREELYRLKYWGTAAVMALLTAGCSVYTPTLIQAPMVYKRNQAEVAISYHFPTQFEVSGAYAPLKNILVTGNIAHHPDFNLITSGNNHYYGTEGDMGLGLYTTFGKSHWYAGVLGGYGFSASFIRFDSTRTQPADEYRSHHSYAYAQPYLAWHNNKGISIGAAARQTALHFSQLEFNNQPVTFPVATRFQTCLLFLELHGNDDIVSDDDIYGRFQIGYSFPQHQQPPVGELHSLPSSNVIIGISLVCPIH